MISNTLRTEKNLTMTATETAKNTHPNVSLNHARAVVITVFIKIRTEQNENKGDGRWALLVRAGTGRSDNIRSVTTHGRPVIGDVKYGIPGFRQMCVFNS